MGHQVSCILNRHSKVVKETLPDGTVQPAAVKGINVVIFNEWVNWAASRHIPPGSLLIMNQLSSLTRIMLHWRRYLKLVSQFCTYHQKVLFSYHLSTTDSLEYLKENFNSKWKCIVAI
jgi:hypothetical protein